MFGRVRMSRSQVEVKVILVGSRSLAKVMSYSVASGEISSPMSSFQLIDWRLIVCDVQTRVAATSMELTEQ